MNDRDVKAIRFLAQKNDFVTSDALAEYLNVSPRTVMRLIKNMNEMSQPDQLIHSEKGRGYRIDYDVYLKISSTMNELSSFSPTERRNEVLLQLLFRAPQTIKTEKLFEKFFISETVMNKDSLIIADQLRHHRLELVRKGKTLAIHGSERAIRQFIIKAIAKLGITDYQSMRREFTDLSTFDMQFMNEQMDYIERNLHSTIPAPYNINLFSHMYILMKRYRQGILAGDADEQLSPSEKKTIQENHALYDISSHVIDHLSAYLNRDVSPIEKYYILQYLTSSRLLSPKVENNEYSNQVLSLVDKIVVQMSKRYGSHIDSKELRNDLAQHVKPLLNRLENGISVDNSMLQDIKAEYADVYKNTAEVVNDIFTKELKTTVSDDEAGFMALYFIKYLEQNPPKANVLIMCASGIGTSELLRVKVKKYFPQLNIVDVVSVRQYEKRRAEYDVKTDLIITTVQVKDLSQTRPMILVNAMFTESDQKRVSKKIKELRTDERA